MKKKILTLSILFLLLSGLSIGVKHVGVLHQKHENIKEYTDTDTGIYDFISSLIMSLLPIPTAKFTVINDYLCSTYPDDTGICWNPVCDYTCPTSTKGGCAIEVFNEDGEHRWSWSINPGGSFSLVYVGYSYELYECNLENCVCSDFEDKGCGVEPCSGGRMLRERSCNPPNCDDEEVCIVYPECSGCDCTAWDNINCGGSISSKGIYCSDSEMLQGRVCPYIDGIPCNVEVRCEPMSQCMVTTTTTTSTTTTLLTYPEGYPKLQEKYNKLISEIFPWECWNHQFREDENWCSSYPSSYYCQFQSDNPTVISKANEFSGNKVEKLIQAYSYVVNLPIKEGLSYRDPENCIKLGETADCDSRSGLLIGLAQSEPLGYGKDEIFMVNSYKAHVYVIVKLDNQWLLLDPTTEHWEESRGWHHLDFWYYENAIDTTGDIVEDMKLEDQGYHIISLETQAYPMEVLNKYGTSEVRDKYDLDKLITSFTCDERFRCPYPEVQCCLNDPEYIDNDLCWKEDETCVNRQCVIAQTTTWYPTTTTTTYISTTTTSPIITTTTTSTVVSTVSGCNYNGVCDINENQLNCPADCSPTTSTVVTTTTYTTTTYPMTTTTIYTTTTIPPTLPRDYKYHSLVIVVIVLLLIIIYYLMKNNKF